ncbi:amidohydrolase family protein [Streptomyces sp. NPDC059063]|uniref:amidohydrolase family protein n=1 Tax=unclassified Streptomyces TaxID=2593676 RepID=UPI0036A37338
MRVIALEEHFTTAAIRRANADHPMERFYRMLADEGFWPPGDDRPPGITDLGERRLSDMDASGIDVQVLSHTVPATESLDPGVAVGLAREANDVMADAVAAHPDRFAALATLPMTDPEAAAAELERTVSTLGFRGAMVNGHVGGRYLDDPSFRPVFACAEALSVPVYLHPNRPPQAVFDACYSGFSPLVDEALGCAAWGWHVDTGLHALRLIVGGVFDRFPGLQMIIGHMGEALPSMIWRADWMLTPAAGLPRRVKDYFCDHFSVTTSGVFDYAPFVSALHALGTDRILFSVDYPYSANAAGRAFLDGLPVSPADREKIAHGNAERILGLTPDGT